MKISVLFILMTSFCIFSGCSSPSVAKYTALPTPVGCECPNRAAVNAAELQLQAKRERESKDFFRDYDAADLVLKTSNFQSFDETKPVQATITLETLRDLLRDNKKLPGNGIVFVVTPRYGMSIFWKMGEEPPHDYSIELRQMLKDAGFVKIYFCTDMDLISLE